MNSFQAEKRRSVRLHLIRFNLRINTAHTYSILSRVQLLKRAASPPRYVGSSVEEGVQADHSRCSFFFFPAHLSNTATAPQSGL